MHASPQPLQSSYQVTFKTENNQTRQLKINVSQAISRFTDLIPKILNDLEQNHPSDFNASKTNTLHVIAYDINRKKIIYQYGNLECEAFLEYFERPSKIRDLAIVTLTGQPEEAAIPQQNTVQLTSIINSNDPKALGKAFSLYAEVLDAQNTPEAQALAAQMKLTAALNETPIAHDKVQEILQSGKPLTLFLGYYRGEQWIPYLLTIKQEAGGLQLRTLSLDPVLGRKVEAERRYQIPLNENTQKNLENALSQLRRYGEKPAPRSVKEGVAASTIMSGMENIAKGGAGEAKRLIRYSEAAKDLLEILAKHDPQQKKRFDEAVSILRDEARLEVTDLTINSTLGPDAETYLKEQIGRWEAKSKALHSPPAEWTADTRDVASIFDAILMQAGSVRQNVPLKPARSSNDPLKMSLQWIIREQPKLDPVNLEVNCVLQLVREGLSQTEKNIPIAAKLKIVESLEPIVGRYLKHQRSKAGASRAVMLEQQALFGPLAQKIFQLRHQLTLEALSDLDKPVASTVWNTPVQPPLPAPVSKLENTVPFHAEAVVLRRQLTEAIANAQAVAAHKALTDLTALCTKQYNAFNYAELAKGVSHILGMLPVPLSGTFWSAVPPELFDSYSETLTLLTQYLWEAQLKTGKAGLLPQDAVNVLNTRAILQKLFDKRILSSPDDRVLAACQNFRCDTTQAIQILTRHPYLRFGRNPLLENRAMELLKCYKDFEQDSRTPISLDAYRTADSPPEKEFFRSLGSALGKQVEDGEELYTFTKATWQTSWKRNDKNNVLPNQLIDLRRNALFTQSMFHPEWVMVKGFDKNMLGGIDKAKWLGHLLIEVAAETGETDPDRQLKLAAKKEALNLKNNLYSMDHLVLSVGEDIETGFQNEPAINITDSKKTYLIGYHAGGFETAELRDPLHEEALVGQKGKIPRTFASTRITAEDDFSVPFVQRKREMEQMQPWTELSVLLDEKWNASSTLTEEQNVKLRSLLAQASRGTVASSVTFLNVFDFIWKNTDQLENETVQRILTQSLLAPGLLQYVITQKPYLLTSSDWAGRLTQLIGLMIQQGRVKSAVFLMQLGALIKSQAANDKTGVYARVDQKFSAPANPVLLKAIVEKTPDFGTAYTIKGKSATGFAYLDRVANTGQLDSAAKKFLYTSVLTHYLDKQTPLAPLDFLRIFNGYAALKNIWGDSGDPVLQAELVDWVESHVMPQFEALPAAQKNQVLTAFANGSAIISQVDRPVEWAFKKGIYVSPEEKQVNLWQGTILAKGEKEQLFACEIPDDIAAHPTYNALFGKTALPALRVLHNQGNELIYRITKDKKIFELQYNPLKKDLRIYQTINNQPHLFISNRREGQQAATLFERYGIWQNVDKPAQGYVILNTDGNWNDQDLLSLSLDGKPPLLKIKECTTAAGRKVVSDPAGDFKRLFPFADPADTVLIVDKGHLSEVRFISKKITLKRDPQKGWRGVGDYSAYSLMQTPDKRAEIQTVFGTNYFLFALPLEKVIVSTTRLAKDKTQIVQRRVNTALIFPVKLIQTEGRLTADSSSAATTELSPLNVTYETEEVLKEEEKGLIVDQASRSKIRSSTAGFFYLAYNAYAAKEYEKAIRYLQEAQMSPYVAHEAKTLEHILTCIRENADHSIQGTAFRLKVELAARQLIRDRQGLKEFRPATWDAYLKKVQSDVALYQSYKERRETKGKGLHAQLILTPAEEREFEQLIKEGFTFLVKTQGPKAPGSVSSIPWKVRGLPKEVQEDFTKGISHAMQPPKAEIKLEQLPTAPAAAQFLANFWSYADQIRKEKIPENDKRIDYLRNMQLQGLTQGQAKEVEAGRQLLIALATANSLEQSQDPQLKQIFDKFRQLPPVLCPPELFNQIFKSQATSSAEELRQQTVDAAAATLWASILKAIGFNKLLPFEVYAKVGTALRPLYELQELVAAVQPEINQYLKKSEVPPESGKRVEDPAFTTSLRQLEATLAHPHSAFTNEEAAYWKSIVSGLKDKNEDPDKATEIVSLIQSFLIGTKIQLASVRHEAEVIRAVAELEKTAQSTPVRKPKDPEADLITRSKTGEFFGATIDSYKALIKNYFKSDSWKPSQEELQKSAQEMHGQHPLSTLFIQTLNEIRIASDREQLKKILIQTRMGNYKKNPQPLLWILHLAAKTRLYELEGNKERSGLPELKTLPDEKLETYLLQAEVKQLDEESKNEKLKLSFQAAYTGICTQAKTEEKITEILQKYKENPFYYSLAQIAALRIAELKAGKMDTAFFRKEMPPRQLIPFIDEMYQHFSSNRLKRIEQQKNTWVYEANQSLFELRSNQIIFSSIYNQIRGTKDKAFLIALLKKPDVQPFREMFSQAIAIRLLELDNQISTSRLPVLTSTKQLAELLTTPQLKIEFAIAFESIRTAATENEIKQVLNSNKDFPFISVLIDVAAIRNAEIDQKKEISSIKPLFPFAEQEWLHAIQKRIPPESIKTFQNECKRAILAEMNKNKLAVSLAKFDTLGPTRPDFIKFYESLCKAVSKEEVLKLVSQNNLAHLREEISYLGGIRLKEIEQKKPTTLEPIIYFNPVRLPDTIETARKGIPEAALLVNRDLFAPYLPKEPPFNYQDVLTALREGGEFFAADGLLQKTKSELLTAEQELPLGQLYQKIVQANSLAVLQQIMKSGEALPFLSLLAPFAALRADELEWKSGHTLPERLSGTPEASQRVLKERLDATLNKSLEQQAKMDAKQAIANMNVLLRSNAFLKMCEEIGQCQTEEQLNSLITGHRNGDFHRYRFYLSKAAALRAKEIQNGTQASQLKNLTSVDFSLINKLLSPISAVDQAKYILKDQYIQLFKGLEEYGKQEQLAFKTAQLDKKGAEIVAGYLTQNSSPMEAEENKRLKQAIDAVIHSKKNENAHDPGVLTQNPAYLHLLRKELSGYAEKIVVDMKPQLILSQLRTHVNYFPQLKEMLQRNDLYSNEEILDAVLDLYKSHDLRSYDPTIDEKVREELNSIEVLITKYLYDVTELVQINKALETLTEMESLSQTKPKTEQEQINFDIEWEERSKTLLGFINGAKYKARYINPQTLTLEKPEFSRRHLVAEFRNEMIARPAQPITVEKMVGNLNSLILLRPGAGKSKWITPEVAQLIAKEKGKLPIILVTEELVHINRQDLDRDTRKMFNQAGHIFDFHRNTPKDIAYLMDEYQRILHVKQSHGYIVTTIGKLAALDDEIVSVFDQLGKAVETFQKVYGDFYTRSTAEMKEASKDPEFLLQLKTIMDIQKQLHWLKKLREVVRKECAYVADEVDDIFNINRDYNYSVSGPNGEGMRQPNLIVRTIMHDLMQTIMSSSTKPVSDLKELIQNNEQATLSPQKQKIFFKGIAEALYDQEAPFNIDKNQWQQLKARVPKNDFVNFIVEGKQAIGIPWDDKNEALKAVAALKHLLTLTLPGALRLKADVDYGLSPDGFTVVPKKEGQEIPNVRFGDEYELIVFQYLYQASKPPSKAYFLEQWRKQEDLLESGDDQARAIWGDWKRNANLEELTPTMRQEKLYEQFSSKNSWKQRFALLKTDILENKVKLYQEQIKCNAQDPLDNVSITGASGTVNDYALPDSFVKDESVQSREVMADTLLKIALMKEKGINEKATVFSDATEEVIKKAALDPKCQFVVDQGAATEGKTTEQIVNQIRTIGNRQVLYVTKVMEGNKEIRKQMLWNPGEGAPQPFERSKMAKNCLVYFGPADTRGTDWPIPPSNGILITGATTTDDQFIQAIWRARKLGAGQTIDWYLHKSAAAAINPDGNVTMGDVFNDIKNRTLNGKGDLNMKALQHKISNVIPQAIKRELFAARPIDIERYWNNPLLLHRNINKAKPQEIEDLKLMIQHIHSDCQQFAASRHFFIEKREINFKADFAPVVTKPTAVGISERFDQEIEKALKLDPNLKNTVVPVLKQMQTKVKEEFNTHHAINLKTEMATSGGGSANSQEQVQEQQQQQQQQQQMVAAVVGSDVDRKPYPNRVVNKWVDWTSGDVLQKIQHPDQNTVLTATQLTPLNCGFSHDIATTVNYLKIWQAMSKHEGELLGRVAIVKTSDWTRFVLIDQMDTDRGILPLMEQNLNASVHVSLNSIHPASKESLLPEAVKGPPLALSPRELESLVQIKVLAGCLNFNDQEVQALQRWADKLNPDQKANIKKLYCKMRKADQVNQIAGWLESPLAKILK